MRVDDRDAVRAALARPGHRDRHPLPVPIHLQPAYAELGLGRGDFPVTERLAGEILSLPMYPELPAEALERWRPRCSSAPPRLGGPATAWEAR